MLIGGVYSVVVNSAIGNNKYFDIYFENAVDIKVIIGSVLREFRQEKSISQETLAFEANLDRSYISKLETGVYQPSMTTLFAIAEVLEIDPSEMVKQMYEVYLKNRDIQSG